MSLPGPPASLHGPPLGPASQRRLAAPQRPAGGSAGGTQRLGTVEPWNGTGKMEKLGENWGKSWEKWRKLGKIMGKMGKHWGKSWEKWRKLGKIMGEMGKTGELLKNWAKN